MNVRTFERRLRDDVAADTERALANGRLSDIVDRALAEVEAPASTSRALRRRRSRWPTIAVAAALVTAAASAAWWVSRTSTASPALDGERQPDATQPSAPLVAPTAPSPSEQHTTEQATTDQAVDEQAIAEPSGSGLHPPAAVPSARTHATPPPRIAVAAPETTGPSLDAGALFAEANRLRGEGRAVEAATKYRELQARFPSSREARISHVLLGRWLLDHGHDPAGALEQFGRYLREHADGPLREQALSGRATALEQLGNRSEERAAWEALLREYPDSIHAERARVRLAELVP